MKTSFESSGLLTIAAFRYCLGRCSYIVSECCEHLITNWDNLHDATKILIVEEIEEAFEKGCYGMRCDKNSWQRVLDHASMRGGNND